MTDGEPDVAARIANALATELVEQRHEVMLGPPSCSSGASKRSWSRSTTASCDWRGSPRSKDPTSNRYSSSTPESSTGATSSRTPGCRSSRHNPLHRSIVDRARQPEDPLPTGVLGAGRDRRSAGARPRTGDRLAHGGATADDRRRRCAGQGARAHPSSVGSRCLPSSALEPQRSRRRPRTSSSRRWAPASNWSNSSPWVQAVDVQRLVGWLRDAMGPSPDIDALTLEPRAAARWLDGAGPAVVGRRRGRTGRRRSDRDPRSDLSGIEHLLAMTQWSLIGVIVYRPAALRAHHRGRTAARRTARAIEVRPQQRTASAS